MMARRFLVLALIAAAVGAMPLASRAATLTTIARFPTFASGNEPVALVAADDGRLYGQTFTGGYGKCECGEVFSLTPRGKGWPVVGACRVPRRSTARPPVEGSRT